MSKELERIYKEFFNDWDLQVSNLDNQDVNDQNNEMFNRIINSSLYITSSMKDKIINAFKDDTKKMYNELSKLEKKEEYKMLLNINKFALKLQSDYNRMNVLKCRRTKENLYLKGLIAKEKINN